MKFGATNDMIRVNNENYIKDMKDVSNAITNAKDYEVGSEEMGGSVEICNEGGSGQGGVY